MWRIWKVGTSFKQYLYEKQDYTKIKTHLEYHDTLNPKLWEQNKLSQRVSDALERIAQEFIEFLAIPSSSVSDIIITGSNCSFNYSKLSDIDLHLIVNEKNACPDCPGSFIKDCFKAKKNLWNRDHNIKIHGYPVELYAQPEGDNLVAAGIYSLRKNKWIKHPSNNAELVPPSFDDISVKSKAGELMDQIDAAIDDKVTDRDSIQILKDRIKRLRQSGLEKGSEYSVENLAWKTVRNNGYLDKLDNYVKNLDDASLSLED